MKTDTKLAHDSLNARQRMFIACYQGNATQAARRAGYTGSENTLYQTAHDLLRNPKVASAIQAHENEATGHYIASSNEVKIFWTGTIRDERAPIEVRVRCGELLLKSRGEFVHFGEHCGTGGQPMAPDKWTDFSHLGFDAIAKLLRMTDVPKGGYKTGFESSADAQRSSKTEE